MGTCSVLLPVAPSQPRQVLPYAELVDATSFARLWTGQLAAVDPLQVFSHLAGSGVGVPVGTAVMLMPLKTPFEAAMQIRATALTTGHPVVAGFAPGSPAAQRAIRGAEYASPRTASAEYLQAVRNLLYGDEYTDGQYYPVHIQQPTLEHPPVKLGLGVLRPRMAYTAGQTADVAITWLAGPDYIRDVLAPALVRGARDADRPAPRIAAVVHVAPGVSASAAHHLAYLACAGHLGSPHYSDMLNRAGIRADPNDPRDGARLLVESRVFVTGPMESVATELRNYFAAGVDEVVLNLTAVNLVQTSVDTVGQLKELLGLIAAGVGRS